MTAQVLDAPASFPAPASSRKILIGGAAIAGHITRNHDRKVDRKVVRWLYGQVGKLPIFQLDENGTLYAFSDELDAHFEQKAAEAKAARIAIAEAKAADKEATVKAAAAAARAVRPLPHRPGRQLLQPGRAPPRQSGKRRRAKEREPATPEI
jgi:hypothetical protein